MELGRGEGVCNSPARYVCTLVRCCTLYMHTKPVWTTKTNGVGKGKKEAVDF